MIDFPTILLRLCLALILGASIGFEREVHEHTAAGFRTNALVAIGAALFMIVSAYGFGAFLNTSRTIQVNPAQIASYVVAGIGFLGAGAIFKSQEGDKVRGLTTAAAIWVVAAIGLACGIGMLSEAVAATILALIVLIVLHLVEQRLLHRQLSTVQHIRIETSAVTGEFIGEIYNTCARTGASIQKVGVRAERDVETVELTCHVPDTATLVHTINELHKLSGVQAVNAHLHGSAVATA